MRTRLKKLLLPISTICLVLYAIFLSDKLGKFVIEGLHITINYVLPTGLPFMIISDLYRSLISTCNGGIYERIFCGIFGLPKEALGCFLCGNICGFPIGAIGAGELYKSRIIDKKSAERLIPISNNPSLSFVVGGVGLGIYNDIKAGVILALSVILSAAMTGVIFRGKNKTDKENVNFTSHKFNLVESVKKCGLAFVSIASFIMVFSVLAGILETLLPDFMKPVVALFLEVTRGARFFSSAKIALHLSISLSAFTLGFGGISVLMQSMALTSDLDISFSPYVFLKLTQGIFAFFISYCICIFIY